MVLGLDISTHQNQISICSGNSFFCTLNSDTLVSSAIAMVVTLMLGFLVAWQLKERRPGKLQMVFEAALGYVRNLTHDTVSDDAEFIVPIAMTLGFFILIANWIDFFPLSKPIVPANSDWNLTFAMALMVFIIVQAYAVKVKGLVRFLQYSPAATTFIPIAIGVLVGSLVGALLPGLVIGFLVGEVITILGVITRPHRESGMLWAT